MYKNILLPIDLSEESSGELVLPTAREYAEKFGATIHVMTVMPKFGMSMVSQFFPKNADEQMIKGATEALHAFSEKQFSKDITVRHIISQGTVYEAIIDAAVKINADLIIMSAHRPELKDYLLGPNAARVVRHSDRSVLVIRG